MTRHHKDKSRAKLLRSLYIWHRYMGLAAALFVIVLAVTGLALNHTQELGLDSNYVKSGALLNWYGVQAPENITSYPVDNRSYYGTRFVSGNVRRAAVTVSGSERRSGEIRASPGDGEDLRPGPLAG